MRLNTPIVDSEFDYPESQTLVSITDPGSRLTWSPGTTPGGKMTPQAVTIESQREGRTQVPFPDARPGT